MTAKLTRLNAKIKTLKDSLLSDETEAENIAEIMGLVAEATKKRDALKSELDKVAMLERNPMAETLVEIQTLADINPELLRNRINSLIGSIWVYTGKDMEKRIMLATVQVHYHNGLVRKYWLRYYIGRTSHPLPDAYQANGSILLNEINPSEDPPISRKENTRNLQLLVRITHSAPAFRNIDKLSVYYII